MIFYQQAAIADKKLRPDDLKAARWDTAVGTVLTQCLTGAVLVTAAGALASSGSARTALPLILGSSPMGRHFRLLRRMEVRCWSGRGDGNRLRRQHDFDLRSVGVSLSLEPKRTLSPNLIHSNMCN
jgi:hypothetical protein